MSDAAGGAAEARDLRRLRLPSAGTVEVTGDALEPVRLVDVDGLVDEPVGRFVRHLVACDYSAATCRSYALSLLRWLRFLAAVEVSWDRAERGEVRDFVLWMKGADNPQRRRRSGSTRPGSVNAVTGKPALAEGYAPATINHALSAVRMFYDYHLLTGAGQLTNPVPAQRGRDGARGLAHRSRIEPVERLPRGAYRQRQPARPPRALPDAVFSEFFAALPSNRDRAIVALGVGSGPRASELLELRLEDLDIGRGLVALTGKGHRDVEWVPASPDAMLWLASYLAETEPLRPAGDTRLWRTLRRPIRPLGVFGVAAGPQPCQRRARGEHHLPRPAPDLRDAVDGRPQLADHRRAAADAAPVVGEHAGLRPRTDRRAGRQDARAVHPPRAGTRPAGARLRPRRAGGTVPDLG